MTNSSLSESRLKTLLREPTLHFLSIAIVIFALYTISQNRGAKILEIDQREIAARIFMQEMTRGASLTEAHRQVIASL